MLKKLIIQQILFSLFVTAIHSMKKEEPREKPAANTEERIFHLFPSLPVELQAGVVNRFLVDECTQTNDLQELLITIRRLTFVSNEFSKALVLSLPDDESLENSLTHFLLHRAGGAVTKYYVKYYDERRHVLDLAMAIIKALINKTKISTSQKDVMKLIMLQRSGTNSDEIGIFAQAMSDECTTAAYWLIANNYSRRDMTKYYLKAIPTAIFEKNKSFMQGMLLLIMDKEREQEIFSRYADEGFLAAKDLVPNDEIYSHLLEFCFLYFPWNKVGLISCSQFVGELVPLMLQDLKWNTDIRDFWQAALDRSISTIVSLIQVINLKDFPCSRERIMTIALMCACEKDHALVVETLLQHFRPRWITSNLMEEALTKNNLLIVQLLLKHLRYPSLEAERIGETLLPAYLGQNGSYSPELLNLFCRRAFSSSLLGELVFHCICCIQNQDFEAARTYIQQLPAVNGRKDPLIHIIMIPLLKNNCLELTKCLVLHCKLPPNCVYSSICAHAKEFPELFEFIRQFEWK